MYASAAWRAPTVPEGAHRPIERRGHEPEDGTSDGSWHPTYLHHCPQLHVPSLTFGSIRTAPLGVVDRERRGTSLTRERDSIGSIIICCERSGPEGNGGHSRLLRDFYNNIKSVVAVRCDHETRDREPKARRNEANGSNSKETTKVISSIFSHYFYYSFFLVRLLVKECWDNENPIYYQFFHYISLLLLDFHYYYYLCSRDF